MADKSNFLSFRSESALADWVKAYAKQKKMSVSDVIREAMEEYRARRNAASHMCAGGEDMLREETGFMFRLSRTESGIFLEKVRPDVVELR